LTVNTKPPQQKITYSFSVWTGFSTTQLINRFQYFIAILDITHYWHCRTPEML
jgi:hypothetical protein